ncbi:hypothetical protein BW247_07965 [Acidihalobacter ferrooxydans]|uniref:diguanylate cyclase n=1 Tax=Acidihalobacter ferrooxydans TaxID=1765967 RepID=A0A1P8UL90_9GAMM|nr:hypothetical protein BW247_07965 [Acidihalobacter ferrooxydans]
MNQDKKIPSDTSTFTETANDSGIKLLLRLQQTLDIETLIRYWADFLERDMGIDGFHYRHHEEAIDCHNGHLNRHEVAYTLKLDDRALGEIRFYRARPFSPLDSRRIENLLALLMHPLNNALLYRQALRLAHTDPLTGLCNRSDMDKQLLREISLANREQRPLSLLVADIDSFKVINDRYGHSNGDRILVCVANSLMKSLRDSDLVFRYGGEEFVIVLSGSDGCAAHHTAERLRLAIENLSLTLDDGRQVGTTISIGVSTLNPTDDRASLFNRADAALYQAKQAGRNRIVMLPNLSIREGQGTSH